MNIQDNKIAFLSHPYHRGGVTRWMIDAAEELSSRGIEVYFISGKVKKPFISAGQSSPIFSMFKRENSNIRFISSTIGYFFELGSSKYRAYTYYKLVKKYLPKGVPIIVSNDPPVWEAAAMTSSRNPMIGVLHGDDAHYYRLARKYCNNLSLLVAVSRRVKQNCYQYLPLETQNISVIPCGIPLQKNDIIDNHENNILYLIWVGRIEEQAKRVSDLVKISLSLREQNIDFILNIIGDGPKFNWLKEEISKHTLENFVRLHGWMNSDNVHKLMKQSDILILTSNYEGMSVAVMEGLSNGCGIVSTRVSGVEDLEKHPYAADCLRLFSVGDIHEAVGKILQLKAITKATRRTVALKIAEQEFSIKVCIDRYITAFKNDRMIRNGKSRKPIFFFPIIILSYTIASLRFLKIKFLPKKLSRKSSLINSI